MWLSKSMRAMWWQKTWPLPGPQLLVDLRCTSHREENGNSFQHVRVLPGHTQSFGLGPHSANLYLATGTQRLQPILETGSPPTLTTGDISHGGDVHSPTAGAWLTHLRALAAHFTPLGHFFNVYVHIATCTIITNKHWLCSWQWFGSWQIKY